MWTRIEAPPGNELQRPRSASPELGQLSRCTPRRVVLAAPAAHASRGRRHRNWRVTISIADETVTGKASLKQTGDKVTGWSGLTKAIQLPSMELSKGTASPSRRTHGLDGPSAFDKCHLTVNGDKMTGTVEPTKGTIEFVRVTP